MDGEFRLPVLGATTASGFFHGRPPRGTPWSSDAAGPSTPSSPSRSSGSWARALAGGKLLQVRGWGWESFFWSVGRGMTSREVFGLPRGVSAEGAWPRALGTAEGVAAQDPNAWLGPPGASGGTR